jgi:NAD(P)-dependent dehydrogenase (short-subunit alcohol dehydrogenase family)
VRLTGISAGNPSQVSNCEPEVTLSRIRKVSGALVVAGAAPAGIAAGVALALAGRRVWRTKHAFRLSGKTVLITGGSRGLGFAVAEQFLRHGCRVGICARDEQELSLARRKLSALGEVLAVRCDLRQPAEIAQMVEAVRAGLGDIDVLVNNAGVMTVGPWQTMTQCDFEEAMLVHLWAALWTTLQVLPAMVARHEGRVINISSIGGLIGVPHMLPYAASKFALTGLSEAWRAELMRYGIRMTLVCPWLMRTGSQEQAAFKGNHEAEFAWFALSGATPVSAMAADRAARRIVQAARLGEARVVLAIPGKLAAFAHGIAPAMVNNMMGIINRLLPEPAAMDGTCRSGAASYNAWTERLLRPFVQRAGERYNQPSAA